MTGKFSPVRRLWQTARGASGRGERKNTEGRAMGMGLVPAGRTCDGETSRMR